VSGYVFDRPQLLRQLARAWDAARVTGSVVLRLPGFARRYRRAYAHAAAGEPLPEDAPAMRPFTFLAVVVVLTTLLAPLARRLAGLPARADGVAAAQHLVDPAVTVVHLARLTGMETLDGLIADGVMIASYALFAALFRLLGGPAFDFPWIAGFFAYVVGAFEAVRLVGMLAAIAAGAAEPALAASLTAGIGYATLAATLGYALFGPIVAWPAVLAVPHGRVVRVTLLAVVLWAALQAVVRIAFWSRDVLLLGFGL
jgi:hypothetical protein